MGNSHPKKVVKELTRIDPETVSSFPYHDAEIIARVIDVYDGDTCTVIFLWNKVPHKIKIRFYGIDTADFPRRKDGSDKTVEERELAAAAKEYVCTRIENQCVVIKLKGYGKWAGRILGEIFCIDRKCRIISPSLSEQLLDAHLAVPYGGGTKEKDWKPLHRAWKNNR